MTMEKLLLDRMSHPRHRTLKKFHQDDRADHPCPALCRENQKLYQCRRRKQSKVCSNHQNMERKIRRPLVPLIMTIEGNLFQKRRRKKRLIKVQRNGWNLNKCSNVFRQLCQELRIICINSGLVLIRQSLRYNKIHRGPQRGKMVAL